MSAAGCLSHLESHDGEADVGQATGRVQVPHDHFLRGAGDDVLVVLEELALQCPNAAQPQLLVRLARLLNRQTLGLSASSEQPELRKAARCTPVKSWVMCGSHNGDSVSQSVGPCAVLLSYRLAAPRRTCSTTDRWPLYMRCCDMSSVFHTLTVQSCPDTTISNHHPPPRRT